MLRAFGYIRRRATAIGEINAALNHLALVADPPVTAEMPLRAPRIIFKLRPENESLTPEVFDGEELLDSNDLDLQAETVEDNDGSLPEPTFRVSELKSANAAVECISPSASIEKAYTAMLLRKYSQLAVADSETPRQQDIKGIVSFQSIAKALMNGHPVTVGDCIDNNVPYARSDDDLKSVVDKLSASDVVLVIGRDNKLQGIVTAWDLAEEFLDLVDPFKRIGEIEERLRALVRTRLGNEKVSAFLNDQGIWDGNSTAEIERLTMGELERVLGFPEHWTVLELRFDRAVFVDALGKARDYRNRLMHFRDPLTPQEMTHLTNFCDTVREIQL